MCEQFEVCTMLVAFVVASPTGHRSVATSRHVGRVATRNET